MNITSYYESLNQSDCWKLFVQLCNYTKYIYTKFIVWSEGEERSVPLQVERKQRKDTMQRSAAATLSFTPAGDLQATESFKLATTSDSIATNHLP